MSERGLGSDSDAETSQHSFCTWSFNPSVWGIITTSFIVSGACWSDDPASAFMEYKSPYFAMAGQGQLLVACTG